MAVITFEEYLSEAYVNLFGNEREQYKDVVWDILQQSYASIGGIKGNGFRNADDMVKNIPMWKLVRRNGKIVAVTLYKDKAGRKKVALGSDGSVEGKDAISSIIKEDFTRSYGECSERALSFMLKLVGNEFALKYAIHPSKVKAISGDDVEYPVDDNDPEVKRHPQLKEYFYQRDLGGHMHTKIMFGTPGKKIVVPFEV